MLGRLSEAVTLPCEVIVVVDSPDDSTVPYVEKYADRDSRVRVVVNDIEPGPAQAIRYGFERAEGGVVVVTMADGCDDPQQIDSLARLVERGVVVAAASRYSRGGQQVGGPFLKALLSRRPDFTVGVSPASERTMPPIRSRPMMLTSSVESGSPRAPDLKSESNWLRRLDELDFLWLSCRPFGSNDIKGCPTSGS